ncbi:MAG: AraC family transcriptional regulator [Propionibacteriaceae bacterium]|nr:AraC family transcriptional regulator [Propionibacteriaceae bacterium]
MLPSSRGTLYPKRLPDFHRLEPPAAASALVRWVWISSWNLSDGSVSRQHLIGFPALNLAVESTMVGLSGPTTRTSHRDLSGRGWVVGALLRPAAVPAFTDDPASLRDQYVALVEPELHARVTDAFGDPSTGATRQEAADALADWLAARVGEPGPDALLANRLVELAESDPDLLRVGDLAARLGVSERTLQRLATRYVGLGPAALIRRRRLQEAAERIRTDPDADLASLAAELGYADQAHLTNEFTRVLGLSPAGYRRDAAG